MLLSECVLITGDAEDRHSESLQRSTDGKETSLITALLQWTYSAVQI